MITNAAKQHGFRWRTVARLWRWRLNKRSGIVFASVAIPLIGLACVFVAFYVHYARITDARLTGGPFQHSVDFYGSPVILSVGDDYSLSDLTALFRQAGFSESRSRQPNTFSTSQSSADIYANDGTNPSRAHVEIGPARKIARLEVNGRQVKTWSAGSPCLVSLTAGREKRQMVAFRDIPPNLIHAVVSIEDKHFFQHSGLDLPRVIKAAYVDLSDGRKEQGASTLSMQLVRGLWLQPEKNWKRKIAEAMMTMRLEHEWSKEQIFEASSNQVYLGRQAAYSIHGFAAGAQMFFGKPLQSITLSESALLAGMVQRPSYFNPYRNPAKAKERRDLVLLLMRENHYIDEAKYRNALDAPVTVAGPSESGDSLGEPYFLDLAGDEFQEIDQAEGAAKRVYTTIDLNLQRAAAEAIASGMTQVDKLLAREYKKSGVRAEAALIALDPRTGEIKAMVGGRDYGRSQLDRILAKRPPGSVFKPFVYAAALNTAIMGGSQVFTPASTFDDSPATFLSGGITYQPGNFKNESFGTISLRQALAHSDNIAAVKLAEEVGYDSIVALARRAGLNDDIRATPSVALGSYVVTPLEMAAAYTTFANGGMWVKPQMIASATDASGGAIYTRMQDSHQALDPRVAYLMVSMMQEVLRSGTGAGVRSRGFTLPAAGKTGTSRDGWFAGFTSQLLCLVWVGFDDYRDLKLEGAKSALPIWTEFMKKAARFSPYRDAVAFSQPDGIANVKICVDSGKLAGEFCPNTRDEVFISGSEPTTQCDLHGGGTPDAAQPPVVSIDLGPPQP
jgi:penicillin-binding protein 1B